MKNQKVLSEKAKQRYQENKDEIQRRHAEYRKNKRERLTKEELSAMYRKYNEPRRKNLQRKRIIKKIQEHCTYVTPSNYEWDWDNQEISWWYNGIYGSIWMWINMKKNNN